MKIVIFCAVRGAESVIGRYTQGHRMDYKVVDTYIERVIKASYVCTVPHSGVQEIECFQDAQSYTMCGIDFAYSPSKRTIITITDDAFIKMQTDKDIRKRFAEFFAYTSKQTCYHVNSKTQIKR